MCASELISFATKKDVIARFDVIQEHCFLRSYRFGKNLDKRSVVYTCL